MALVESQMLSEGYTCIHGVYTLLLPESLKVQYVHDVAWKLCRCKLVGLNGNALKDVYTREN